MKSPRQGCDGTCPCLQDGLGNDDSGLPSVVLPGTPLSEPGTPLWLGQRQPPAMQQGAAGAHRYQHSSPTPSPLRCCQPAICSVAWLRVLVLQHMSAYVVCQPVWRLSKWMPACNNGCPHGLPSPCLLGCSSLAHALSPVRRLPLCKLSKRDLHDLHQPNTNTNTQAAHTKVQAS